MKKYKTINFFKTRYKDKKDITKNYYNMFITITITITIVYLLFNISNSIIELKELEKYVSNNKDIEMNLSKNQEINQNKNNIEIGNIRDVYSLIGESNIERYVAGDSTVDIDGICYDLNILNQLKNSNGIERLSINNLTRTVDGYMFTVNYIIGDSIENK